MELLHNFGFNPVLLGAQIVNFLVILFLLKKFLYKPILEVLEKRKKEIQDGLQKAEESRLLLEETQEKEKAILKNAQAQSLKIIDETKQQVAEILKVAEETAKKRSEHILHEAKLEIAEETKRAEQLAINHIGKISADMLSQALHGFFPEKTQEEFISRAIEKMKTKQN